jgi:hypothetical protein
MNFLLFNCIQLNVLDGLVFAAVQYFILKQCNYCCVAVLDSNYCDLDEIQAGVQDVGISVVPGQRRPRPLSGHGNSNCRQQ